jgi:hypothetical protein
LNETRTASGGDRRVVGDAAAEVFDVIDSFVEQHGDVVVVEAVDHGAALANTGAAPCRPGHARRVGLAESVYSNCAVSVLRVVAGLISLAVTTV